MKDRNELHGVVQDQIVVCARPVGADRARHAGREKGWNRRYPGADLEIGFRIEHRDRAMPPHDGDLGR